MGRISLTQGEFDAKDEAVIRKALENWDEGWERFNAQLASMDYADDADWLNAFGVKKKGRAGIEKFLAEIFTRPDLKEARFKTTALSIRFISPDVAVVYTDFEGVGQRTPSGKEMAKRQGHQIRVLTLTSDKWLIVSHFIMDEKGREL